MSTMAIRPLSAALRKKAEEELHETPSRITEDIKTLREWIKQQPHLHSVKPSDQWLVSFLRGCKYNMEKTKGKIDMYYTLRSTVPEFFSNRDPFDPDIQELLKLGLLLPLKKCKYEDSPRLILARVGPFSDTSRPLNDLLKVSIMIVEILLLEDDNFTIAGEDVLVDAELISLSLVWQWTPSVAKKLFSCVEKALSVRFKSMHLINAAFFFGAAVRLFKMFLGAKLKNRIHWHNKDLESLYEHFDKSLLPTELGGTEGTVQELTEYWKAKVESYREWFIDNARSDESKRPSNKNKARTIQSVEFD